MRFLPWIISYGCLTLLNLDQLHVGYFKEGVVILYSLCYFHEFVAYTLVSKQHSHKNLGRGWVLPLHYTSVHSTM